MNALERCQAVFDLGATIRGLRDSEPIPAATQEEAIVVAIVAHLRSRGLSCDVGRIYLLAELHYGVDVQPTVTEALRYHAEVSEKVRLLAPLAIEQRLYEIEQAEAETFLARRIALRQAQEALIHRSEAA